MTSPVKGPTRETRQSERIDLPSIEFAIERAIAIPRKLINSILPRR